MSGLSPSCHQRQLNWRVTGEGGSWGGSGGGDGGAGGGDSQQQVPFYMWLPVCMEDGSSNTVKVKCWRMHDETVWFDRTAFSQFLGVDSGSNKWCMRIVIKL